MAQIEGMDAIFNGSDNRVDFKNIVAKRTHLLKIDNGRSIKAPSAVNVTYNAGTLMGLAATGGDAGRYKPYLTGSSDGSQVPVGFLERAITVDNLDNGTAIRLITGGTLYKDMLIGLDSGAITALKGKTIVENGSNLFDF